LKVRLVGQEANYCRGRPEKLKVHRDGGSGNYRGQFEPVYPNQSGR